MPESNLHRVCRRELGPYAILKRVENRLELGMPDTCYCLRPDGISGWVELKQIAALPTRPTTAVRIPTLTREQVLWHEEWRAAGGRVYLLLQAGDNYFLITHALTRLIYEGKIYTPDLHAQASVRGVGQFPTMGILRCLAK